MTLIEHPTETALPRKAARGVRRAQLIEATITTLARKGFSALTVADVAKQAGLSPGIIIFHFTTKHELLVTVLNALATEYRDNWTARVQQAGPSAAERLKAMALADFDRSVFTPERLAAWIAFWGETQGRPVYDEVYSRLDEERRRTLEALCRELVTEGDYTLDPHLAMCALEALGDGLWLGLAGEYANGDGEGRCLDAQKVTMVALSALFPRHFPPAA